MRKSSGTLPTRSPSSIRKLLAVLDLFSRERPILTAEEIIAELGYTRPTGYRYVHELCAAGLLNRLGSAYALGPRIIELDYQIREADPVLRASQSVMQELRAQYGCDVLLANAFGDRIVAIHHERSGDHSTVSFGRGRPMPLFRGAGSKVIIAFLSPARQKRLYTGHQGEIARSGMGADWPQFRSNLLEIRRAGFGMSFGELDPDNVGIAAPVFQGANNAVAGLVMVMSKPRYALTDKAQLAHIIVAAAARVTAAIAELRDPTEVRAAILPFSRQNA
jgi:DNA-binding IclR family transcriptional regulator